MILAWGGRTGPALAGGPSVPTLVDTLEYDPESPAAPMALRRLAESGERGWKALAEVVVDRAADQPELAQQAAALLARGPEPERLEQAARAYDRQPDEDLRATLALGLAAVYPEGAERLHGRIRRGAEGSLELLRILAARGLPEEEVRAALDQPALAGLARDLLAGHAPPSTAHERLTEAHEVARRGLVPAEARAFLESFQAAPSASLLDALAEVLREPDEETRLGAWCLLLSVSGLDIAPDAALWHAWIQGRSDTFRLPDPVSPGSIRAAVLRGIRFLRADLGADGVCYHAHGDNGDSAFGATALVIHALRASGVGADDPAIRKGLDTTLLLFDRTGRPGLRPFSVRWETYGLALLAMALHDLDDTKYREPLLVVRDRIAGGILANGQWTYRCLVGTEAAKPASGDNSNTQYANLGLRAVGASGVEVDPEVWRRVDAHWRNTQAEEGSWGYLASGSRRSSRVLPMTAAGVAGLALAAEALAGGDAPTRIAGDEAVRRGLAHLGRSLFLSDWNRVLPYSLYAVERACRLTGTEAFAGGGRTFDWYREGAWRFLTTQNDDGSWGTQSPRSWEAHGFGKIPDTAFALLFLARATATVADDVSLRTVPARVLPEEVRTPPLNRAPPPGPGSGTAMTWADVEPPAAEAVTLRVPDRLFLAHAGKVRVEGAVVGPWSRVRVGDESVTPDEAGRFARDVEVSASGPIDVVAMGRDGREARATIPVTIDDTPPAIHLVGPSQRRAGKQRLRVEADEDLDGLKVGRYYFPAEGPRGWVTAELAEHTHDLVVLAWDRAGNETRRSFDLQVTNRVLVLDGQSAVRVDLRAKPSVFTLEAWVRPEEPKGRTAALGDCENAGAAVFLRSSGHPDTSGYFYAGGGWVVLDAKRSPRWGRWTHFALTYDGAVARYWVNGKLQGEEAGAPLRPSPRSFFLGAEPDGHNRPASKMTGAIDEVRLSDVVRYADDFRPADTHMADRHTVFLFHFDTDTEGAFLDDSGKQHNGVPVGAPEVVEEKR